MTLSLAQLHNAVPPLSPTPPLPAVGRRRIDRYPKSQLNNGCSLRVLPTSSLSRMREIIAPSSGVNELATNSLKDEEEREEEDREEEEGAVSSLSV